MNIWALKAWLWPDEESIAVILSFFIPGLGQMHLGRVKRGIIILVGTFAVSIPIIWALGWWGILIPVGIELWQMFDAAKIAKQQEQPKPCRIV